MTDRQEPFGLVPRLARLAKPCRGVDANGKHFLNASEAIGETPALRTVRGNPQLQPAAVGEFDEPGAGLGCSDFYIG